MVNLPTVERDAEIISDLRYTLTDSERCALDTHLRRFPRNTLCAIGQLIADGLKYQLMLRS